MVWRTADDEGVNTADWLGGCQLSSVAVIARLGGCRAEQEDKSQRTVHGEVWARATEGCLDRCVSGGTLACRTRRARGGGRLRRPPRGAGGAPREAQRAAGNRTEVGALNPISAPGARWAGSGLPLPFGAETPLPLPCGWMVAACPLGHGSGLTFCYSSAIAPFAFVFDFKLQLV